jgi:hypothetical protein
MLDHSPQNFDLLCNELTKWLAAAARAGRISINDGDEVVVVMSNDITPGHFRIFMTVGDRDLFTRTPPDLKKLIKRVSPDIAESGDTMTQIVYEAPLDVEIGPYAANAKIRTSLGNLTSPVIAFGHIAGLLSGHSPLKKSRDHMWTAAQMLRVAQMYLEDGAFDDNDVGDACKVMADAIMAGARAMKEQKYSISDVFGAFVMGTTRALMVRLEEPQIAATPEERGLLRVLWKITRGLGHLLVERYRSLEDAEKAQEKAISSREAYTLNYFEEAEGGYAVKARVWLLAGLPFYAEILETERIPPAAVEDIRAGRPCAWQSIWEAELLKSERSIDRLNERLDALEGAEQRALHQRHCLIDGHTVSGAVSEALLERIESEVVEMNSAIAGAGPLLVKQPRGFVN